MTLREELLTVAGEPTFDQLTNTLSYLDAVVHETLRVHSTITEHIRIVSSLRFHLYFPLTGINLSGHGGRHNSPFRTRSHSIWRPC